MLTNFLGWHSLKSQNWISSSNSKTKNTNLNQCDFELTNSCQRVAVRKKLISGNDLAIPIVLLCTPLYLIWCTLICTLYGLKRHLSFLCLVHTVYDALLNYAFPFLISFFSSDIQKNIHFRKSIRSHGAAKPLLLLRDSLSGSQSSYKLSA